MPSKVNQFSSIVPLHKNQSKISKMISVKIFSEISKRHVTDLVPWQQILKRIVFGYNGDFSAVAAGRRFFAARRKNSSFELE